MKNAAIFLIFIMVVACTNDMQSLMTSYTATTYTYTAESSEYTKDYSMMSSDSITTDIGWADADTSYFAFMHLEEMQLEQFYVDKPYTEAFAELVNLPTATIEELLADNLEASARFLEQGIYDRELETQSFLFTVWLVNNPQST
jgi:hypothetical protein